MRATSALALAALAAAVLGGAQPVHAQVAILRLSPGIGASVRLVQGCNSSLLHDGATVEAWDPVAAAWTAADEPRDLQWACERAQSVRKPLAVLVDQPPLTAEAAGGGNSTGPRLADRAPRPPESSLSLGQLPATRLRWAAPAAPAADEAGALMERVLITLVVDANARLVHEALALLRSLRTFGGTLNRAKVLAIVLTGVPAEARAALEELGAEVRERRALRDGDLPGATPHSNKILALAEPEARDMSAYDTVIYLDCDVLVLGDLAPVLLAAPGRVLFRSGWTPWAQAVFDDPIWRQIGALAGIDDLAGLEAAVGWANTGVVVVPTDLAAALHDAWLEFADKVAFWIRGAGSQDVYFVDTLAFLLAVAAVARSSGGLEACSAALPLQANLQLNWPRAAFERARAQAALAEWPAILAQYNQGALELLPDGSFTLLSGEELEAFPFLAALNKRLAELNIKTGGGGG